ncbi:unnamed protein product, partial [Mesorhabditis spiculigera]
MIGPRLLLIAWALIAVAQAFDEIGNPLDSEDTDAESEVDLLVPVESALNTDERVFRARGIDGLPAIGIQRGVTIVTPYRLYFPKRFFREFAILAAVKPSDRRGGYLFAIVNPFDTIVDLGVLLEPADSGRTNITLMYSNSRTDTYSKAIASFLVPQFEQEWTQFALEVRRDEVILYFKCVRYSAIRVNRVPEQLHMEDAHKLYIAGAGPIIKSGYEIPDVYRQRWRRGNWTNKFKQFKEKLEKATLELTHLQPFLSNPASGFDDDETIHSTTEQPWEVLGDEQAEDGSYSIVDVPDALPELVEPSEDDQLPRLELLRVSEEGADSQRVDDTGAIQELKIMDEPAEAARQCDERWDEGSGGFLDEDGPGKTRSSQPMLELPPAPTPPPPPPPDFMREQAARPEAWASRAHLVDMDGDSLIVPFAGRGVKSTVA